MQTPNKKQLRQQARKARNSLNACQQRMASQRLFQQVKAHPRFKNAQHIALYLAADGEVDLQPIIKEAWLRGKSCYLPLISNKPQQRQLSFQLHSKGQALRANRFGIAEPARLSRRINAQQLDLVLMPLVAFDPEGNRLGMGGGYYDYSFQHRIHCHFSKPYLLGVGHKAQGLAHIPKEKWDLKPDHIFSA